MISHGEHSAQDTKVAQILSFAPSWTRHLRRYFARFKRPAASNVTVG